MLTGHALLLILLCYYHICSTCVKALRKGGELSWLEMRNSCNNSTLFSSAALALATWRSCIQCCQ